jgi:VanZ family protein
VNETHTHQSGLFTANGWRLLNWAAAFLWMGLIFFMSSMSDFRLRPKNVLVPKLAHVVEYAVLTVLLIRALIGERIAPRRAVVIAGLIALGYAASDEFHQSFVPNRHPSGLDIGIDAVGIGIVAFAVVSWLRRREA